MSGFESNNPKDLWGGSVTEFFHQLNDNEILKAIDSLGIATTGRVLTMGSFENRVYEIETSEETVIAKFYRPGRWSQEQILEEHEFLLELQGQQIPVIAPLKINGQTLFDHLGVFFTLFPRKGGRAVEEMDEETATMVGRQLARIHLIGSAKKYQHRPELTFQNLGHASVNYLLTSPLIPSELKPSFKTVTSEILSLCEKSLSFSKVFRIHGDCHGNNLLNRDSELFFIDFDDSLTGPAIQDIWMIMGADLKRDLNVYHAFIDGYETFCEYPYSEEKNIPYLRLLRLINYHSWVAHRLDDGAFKQYFSHYLESYFWEKEVYDFQKELMALKEIQPQKEKPRGDNFGNC